MEVLGSRGIPGNVVDEAFSYPLQVGFLDADWGGPEADRADRSTRLNYLQHPQLSSSCFLTLLLRLPEQSL